MTDEQKDDTGPVLTPRILARMLSLDLRMTSAIPLPSGSQECVRAVMRWAREDYVAGANGERRQRLSICAERAAFLASMTVRSDLESSAATAASPLISQWMDEDEQAGRLRLSSSTFSAIKP